MSTAVFVLAGVVAILVAAAVPALIQLRRTLQAAQEFFETTGPRLNQRLDEAQGITESIERVSTQLEGIAEHLKRLTSGLGTFGESVGHVGHSVAKVGDTIGRVNETVRQFPGILGALASAAMAGLRAATRGNRNGLFAEEPAGRYDAGRYQQAGRSSTTDTEW